MRLREIVAQRKLPKSTTERIDLEQLLIKVLNKSRSFLYTYPEYELTSSEQEYFEFLYKKRLQGEPIAYLLGKKEFFSLELAVNDKVLIPRPETELLVELALSKVKNKDACIADLGTGSGAIALALAKERPSWKIVATDLSGDALQVASYNAMQLGVNNVEFYCGFWCDALPKLNFDAIISNPPYLSDTDPHLEQGDLCFEPKLALQSCDGLDALRTIILQAKDRLTSGGRLILEHGYDQSKSVRELLNIAGYQEIAYHLDLAGILRAVDAVV